MVVSHARPQVIATRRQARGTQPGPEPSGGLTRKELIDSAMHGGVASLAGAAYPSIYAHEMGHKLAIEALYENANPTVEVNPFSGGVTRWSPSGLSETGQKLGPDMSRAAVSAAGTVVDTAVAVTTFAAGYRLRHKHPLIGTALMGYAGFSVFNSIAYAATALGSEGIPALAAQGNDFAGLALKAGIHPLVSIGFLAAILPAEYLLLRALENHGI